MSRQIMRILIGLTIAALTLGATACGNSSNTANTGSAAGTQAAAASPISRTGAQLTPTASPAVNSANAATATAVRTAGAQQLSEITTDNQFSATKLTARAGVPIALTVTNHGQAVHNWHLLDATNPNGSPIKTDLLAPGSSATIVFTIAKPGTYHFRCDVHPTEMMGTLTIS